MRSRWVSSSPATIGLVVLIVALMAPAPPSSIRAHERPARQRQANQPGEEAARGTAPEDWFITQRAMPNGIPTGALQRARSQAVAIARATAASGSPLARARWAFEGPTNIGGRVIDMVADPTTAGVVYAAAASGGVWKATDDAMTFSPAWPAANPQSMGALAITPDGSTLYAGTGEAGPGGGSITYGSQGIYRSTNGGASWRNAGLRNSGTTGRIVIDPTNPQRIFVAAAGNLFVPGGQRGVYRSVDGGVHWHLVLPGGNDTTGAVDLAIDPTDPNRLYAAMWDHLREPDLRTYGGVGSGVYRSTDGGDTWTRLTNGLPAPSPTTGRIGIAVAPSNPSHLYAIVIQTSGVFQGLYTSVDAGDNWTKQPASGSLSGSQSTYGWWFGRLWVDPADENRVFAAGVSLEVTTNGGQTWAATGNVHADQHAMVFDAATPGRVYLGNDGGVYRNESGGTGAWRHSASEPWNQFYSVDVSEQDPTRIIGGAQDNSVLRSWGGTNWNAVIGGDGEEVLIDRANQLNVYGCSQYGFCDRSTNGGTSFSSFGTTTSARYNWFTSVQFDPTDTAVMYLGGNILNRSTDRAAHWTTVSPDLTGGPGRDPNYPFGTITTVAAAKTDPNELFVGTDDGRVWYTPDLGAHWTRATDPALPQTWVTRVAIDPSNALVAFATFSGFRSGDQTPYVLETTDGGATWTDISGNLPQAPVNDVVIDGSALYVASDVGVFSSSNDGATWRTVGRGLPDVPVDDLELEASTHSLLAGTFGRGIYRIQLG